MVEIIVRTKTEDEKKAMMEKVSKALSGSPNYPNEYYLFEKDSGFALVIGKSNNNDISAFINSDALEVK